MSWKQEQKLGLGLAKTKADKIYAASNEEFAEKLRFGGFLADGFLCKYIPEGHIRINTRSLPYVVAIFFF